MNAQIIGIIGDPGSWPVVSGDDSGPLVRVEIRPNVFVKMRESEARAQGLLPEEKAEAPAPNKARRGARNKGRRGGDAGE